MQDHQIRAVIMSNRYVHLQCCKYLLDRPDPWLTVIQVCKGKTTSTELLPHQVGSLQTHLAYKRLYQVLYNHRLLDATRGAVQEFFDQELSAALEKLSSSAAKAADKAAKEADKAAAKAAKVALRVAELKQGKIPRRNTPLPIYTLLDCFWSFSHCS